MTVIFITFERMYVYLEYRRKILKKRDKIEGKLLYIFFYNTTSDLIRR